MAQIPDRPYDVYEEIPLPPPTGPGIILWLGQRFFFVAFWLLILFWFACWFTSYGVPLLATGLMFILALLYVLSVPSRAHDNMAIWFPRKTYIIDDTLYIKHSGEDDPDNPRPIGFYGNAILIFREEYLISECVWFSGYIKQDSMIGPTQFALPFYRKKAIVIYHPQTFHRFACGLSKESYQAWKRVLLQRNVPKYRNRSRFEPLAVVSLATAAVFGFHFLTPFFLSSFDWVNDFRIFWDVLILCLGGVFGSFLCGNDLFWVSFKTHYPKLLLFLAAGVLFSFVLAQ